VAKSSILKTPGQISSHKPQAVQPSSIQILLIVAMIYIFCIEFFKKFLCLLVIAIP
jgi:hypothetical protein